MLPIEPKGIGNGIPIGAVVTTDIAVVVTRRNYFNTFGGNPVCTAAGHSILRVIEKQRLQENAFLVGSYLKGRLKDLQEKHESGVLFKVYIVGEAIKVVRRFSLRNVDRCQLLKNAGVYQFPRVSCSAASAADVDLDPSIAGYGKMPGYEQIFTEFLLSLAQKSKLQW